MKGYLGEEEIKSSSSKEDYVMQFIEMYSGIDGTHHKDWLIDQIARIIKGTPITTKVAKWDNGYEEVRISTGEPSKEYLDWVKSMRGEYEDGEYEYEYNEGVAP